MNLFIKQREVFGGRIVPIMSEVFEYCASYINEVYGVDISKDKFIPMFCNSYICSCLDDFNIRLIDGGSPRVITAFVEMDLENDFTPILVNDNDVPFNILEANWIGGFYAYLHLFLARPTKEIYKYINLDLMRDYYICGHQVTYEFVYNRLGWFFEENNLYNKLSVKSEDIYKYIEQMNVD